MICYKASGGQIAVDRSRQHDADRCTDERPDELIRADSPTPTQGSVTNGIAPRPGPRIVATV